MSAPISVVIIAYNREPYLSAAIESVLRQTKPDFELLIWDDGSTDRSLEIAQEYAKRDRRIRVIAAKHQGETPARKAAMAEITGTYFGWVDSDDVLAPTALEETAAVLDAHPEAGFVYTDYIDISESGEFISYGKRCCIPYSKERLMLEFMTFHFRLIRRSAFELAGGIDEAIQYISDYDLCVRLSEIAEVKHLNKPLYYYRNHLKSITKERQLEVIRYSHLIMTRALERRGMSDRFFIDLQLHQVDGKIQSRFSLVSKDDWRLEAGLTNSEVKDVTDKLSVANYRSQVTPPVLAKVNSSGKRNKDKIIPLSLLVFTSLFSVNPALAQPIVPANDGTNTIVNPEGNRIDITGGQRSGDGANLFHSFGKFGLSSEQTANFLSQPNIRNILARINGGEVSYINGLIQVTGGNSNLFLMNPSGIVFGANASLNVPAAFMATTANGIGFGNNWFNAVGENNYGALVGNPNAFAFSTNQPGSIINSGTLAVGVGQDLTLLGGTVINTGQLSAPSGNITVAAVPGTSLVKLSQPGFLLSLEIQPIANSPNQPNNFNLPIASLPQMLTGGSGGNATGVQVKEDGTVQLTGSGIRIPTEGNTAIASGKLDVSGKTGGQVNILGGKVRVISSNINASGTNGGGNVRIGGDFQGKGTIPNATGTFVSKDSVISTDSFTAGNGGRVIVWGDKTTRFYGSISAKGGSNSGDGGFVEVSGKEFLDFQGNVNTLAPKGNTGTLLLDPTNIIIQEGPGYLSFTALDQVDQFADPDIGANTIDVALINKANTNVTLQATNNITFDAVVNITAKGVGITAEAKNDITVNKDITTNGGAITLKANSDNNVGGDLAIDNATIKTGGADFTASGTAFFRRSGISLTNSTIDAQGGNILLTGNGYDFSEGSDFDGILFKDSSAQTQGAGNITLNGTAPNLTDNNVGIRLVNAGSKVSVENGTVTLTGKGGNGTGDGNGGIVMDNAAIVQATGTGTIVLEGISGNGNKDNDGIRILRGSKVISKDGNITITGTSNGTGENNDGIIVFNTALVEATGVGTITLTGTSGNAANNNIGIQIQGEGEQGTNATIRAKDGNITLIGKSNGTGTDNIGIKLHEGGGGIVETTGGGSIALTGTGGNGTDLNAGIQVNIGKITATGSGNLTLTGDEINLAGTTQIGGKNVLLIQPLTGSLDISIGGTNNDARSNLDEGELATLQDGFSQIIIGREDSTGAIIGAGNVTFKDPVILQSPLGAGSIDTSGFTITGNEDATITLLANQDIKTGNITAPAGISITSNNGAIDASAGSLNSSSNTENAGAIDLKAAGDIKHAGINAISQNADGGNITVNAGGNLTGFQGNNIDSSAPNGNGGKIIINAGGNIETDDIYSYGSLSGGDINLTSGGRIDTIAVDPERPGTIASCSASTVPCSGGSGKGGNITFQAATDINTGGVDSSGLLGGGNINFSSNGGKVNSSYNSSSTNGSGGAIAVNAAFDITSKTFLDSSSSTSGDGGAIAFTSIQGAIDVSGADVKSSSNSGKGGDIAFSAPIQVSIAKVNSTGLPDTGNISFTSDSINFTGETNSVQGKGSILIQPFTPSQNLDLATTTPDVLADGFSSITIGRIDGTGTITVSKPIAFSDPTTIQSPSGAIAVNAPITGTDNASITLKSLTNTLEADITTQDQPINIEGQVLLGADVKLSTVSQSGGNITISGTVDGNNALTVEAGTGNIQFKDAIGSTTLLSGLTISGQDIDIASTTDVAGDIAITTNGTLNLNNSVTTTNNGSVTITNAQTLTLKGDNFNLDGAFTQNGAGAVSFSGNLFTTNDDISFKSSVTLFGDSAFDAGTGKVNFNSTLTANTFNLTVTANDMNFADKVSGNGGNLILQPSTPSLDIVLGGADDTAALDIKGLFDRLQDGFKSITIGRQDGSGQIKIVNNITFKDPLIIQSPKGAGSITSTGSSINGEGDASITLLANQNITTGNITAPAGITITSNSGAIDTKAGTLNSTDDSTGNGGAIALTAESNIFTSNLISKTTSSGKGGDIIVISNSGAIDTSAGILDSSSNGGIAGNIGLKAPNGIITGAIDSTGLPGTGNISLISDLISFKGTANSVKGKGNILLAPFTSSQNLDIATVNFDVLADGFNSITIGSEKGSGTVNISNAIAFRDPVIIQSPDGTIVVNGAITGTDNASITLSGQTNLNADITTAEQNIDIKGNVLLGNNVTISTGALAGGDISVSGTIDGNKNLTLETGTGNINLLGAVGSTTRLGDFTINSANNFTAGAITSASITQKLGNGTTSLGELNTNTAKGINLTGNIFDFNGSVTTTKDGGFTIDNNSPLNIAASTIFNLDGAFKQIGKGAVSIAGNLTTTDDDISFNSPVNLTGGVTFNTGAGAGDITFKNTLDGKQNLTLNAGSGNITFTGAVGNLVRLENLNIDSAKDVTAGGIIKAASIIQQQGTGTSSLAALDTNTPEGIKLTGNNLNLNDIVTTTNNGSVTINNSGTLNIAEAADMNLDGAFSQIGTGEVFTAGDITAESISFNSPVTLTGNVVFNTSSAAGDINFNNTVDGLFDLNLSAGTGNINVKGAVGNIARLGNFGINSAANITANSITAASISQKNATGMTILGNLNTDSAKGINLKGNNFDLKGTVTTSNNGSFTIDNNSPLNIQGSNFNLDGSFSQIGSGAVSLAGNIATTDDSISFNSPVTLTGNVALNTGSGLGDINFNNTVNGSFDLNLSAGIGDINIKGAAGSLARLNNFSINNAANVTINSLKAATITQKDGTGITTLGLLDTNTEQGINLKSNSFNLNNTVTTNNNGSFTINNSGNLDIAAAAEMKLDGSFNQTGKGAVFTAGNITTTNDDIRFYGPVTLTGNVTFNPGTATIAFNSGLTAGNNPLTLRAGEIIFGGPVSGSSTLLLEPASKDINIAIADSISGAFNLSAATLANLQDGFQSITIGRVDSTGTVTIKDVTFKDPVTILSGNAIAVNGSIKGIDNASITLDSPATTLNGNISTTNQNITLGRAVQLGNDLTISTSSGAGDITFTGTVDGTKQLTLEAGTGNIRFNDFVGGVSRLGKLNITSAQNFFVSKGINTESDLILNVPVTLTENASFDTGNGNISFGSALDSEGNANNLTLNAGNGNITFNGAVGSKQEIGNILIVSAKDLTATSTIQARQLQHTVGTGNIQLQGDVITTGAGGVELQTNGNINTKNITSNGANITAQSNNGTVETGTLDVSFATGTGGTITLIAPGAVTASDLKATGENGGNFTVKSGDRITTANIDVSATLGKGGTVFLDPPNDIQVGYIKAEGGSQGTGGTVDITTDSFFRATGTFRDRNNNESSISTAGGTGKGSIIIRHGGGNLNTPFVVGDATKNGTAAGLTTGADTILPIQSFLGSFTLGNIQIITKESSSPPPPPEVPPAEIYQEVQRQEDRQQSIVADRIPNAPIDSIIGVTEEVFTREFEAYLEIKTPTAIKTLGEIRDRLRQNEKETGVRSAVLYIVFGRAKQGLEALVTCPSSVESTESRLSQSLPSEACKPQENDPVEMLIVTAEGEPIRYRVPNINRAQIIAIARQLQQEVTDKTKLDTTSYLAPAQQLYQMLIAPIEPKIKERGIKNLIFIPDTGLRSVPIAALHDGKGFIIEQYSVSLMPSFSLSNPRYFNLKDASVLAMGASQFTDQAPLPAVPLELTTIADRLWSGRVSLNEAFTVDNLKVQREAKPFGIVHLATHAEFKPGTPGNSYIQFWDKKLGLDQMRYLEWNNPPVHLLVLSACRTALGDKQVELGFAGLALQAGVQSSLASLWYVSDQGTLGLMSEFYEQLKTAPIRAEALRKAQLAMIQGEVLLENGALEGIGDQGGIPLPPELRQLGKQSFSHPYFWAAFTLIGNPW